MKTEEEIKEQKQEDLEFIISAITTELHDLAYLEYFETWENQGGMGWFFNECVQITHKIMLTEGSAYLKWLDVWITNEDEYCEAFSEVTGETCFDWYHMNEARKEFESRYEKDENTRERIGEHIGYLINSFATDTDRSYGLNYAIEFAKTKRENDKLNKIIQDLREINADAKTIETIKNALKVK